MWIYTIIPDPLPIVSVVIHYFNVISVSPAPDKANTPLVVDASAVLAVPISCKGLQPIPWGHPQIIQILGVIQDHQFHLCPMLDVLGVFPDTSPFGYRPSESVPIALDHESIVA